MYCEDGNFNSFVFGCFQRLQLLSELDLALAVYHLFVVAKVVIVRNFAFSDMVTLLYILLQVIRFPSFTIIM